MAVLKEQGSLELDNLETHYNELYGYIDDTKDTAISQTDITKKVYQKYKKQSFIFANSDSKELDLNEYVDLRNDIDSSAFIHIMMKSEKNKQEQNFIKNAIQGLQLFENHQNLLTTQGFGNHLFSQMKIEFHEKNSIIFHYGDYGQKYYIILKGKLDLLMPKSEYIEENNTRIENRQSPFPYFDESRNIPEELQAETFDQYIDRVYPKMGFIKTFLPGEAFGEIALMTNQQRTGSIIAREDSFSLVITKSAFHELLGKFHEFMQMQKLEFLSQFFFLKQIPDSKLLSIIQIMKVFNFQRNNIIYNEKQNTNGIYFVKEGEVQISTKITQSDENDQDESQKLKIRFRSIKKAEKVVIKAQNTFFGEEEIILSKHQRMSKALCLSENCQVYFLSRDGQISSQFKEEINKFYMRIKKNSISSMLQYYFPFQYHQIYLYYYFQKQILNTYGRVYNVVKKLKQNYDLKAKWEQERIVNLQNIRKQNEENINTLNQNKVKEVSLSKYMIQENNYNKGRQSYQGLPNIMSDELIDTQTSTYQSENQMGFQYQKHRKLSQNTDSLIFSSPKNNKNEAKQDFGSTMQQQNNHGNSQERNNNFHILNGYQSQNSSQKRQSSYLSPQPNQIQNIFFAQTPEISQTGRKLSQQKTLYKNNSINVDDALESFNGFCDNKKDQKQKISKSPVSSNKLQKNNTVLNVQNNQKLTNNGSAIFLQNHNVTGTYYYHHNQGNQGSQTKYRSNNNSREASIERIFFDSSHAEFESMLRKQTQLKQEILSEISKTKNPNLDALIEVNKQRLNFKIRKQSLQYLPTTPKSNKHLNSQSSSLISGFNTTKQVKSSSNINSDTNNFSDHTQETKNMLHQQGSSSNISTLQHIPISLNSNERIQNEKSSNNLDRNQTSNERNQSHEKLQMSNENIQRSKERISSYEKINNERVVVVPASMANHNIQLNYFSTKVQGNDQVQPSSQSSLNVNQHQQNTLNQQTSIQVNEQKQPTLFQLDTLLEEEDEHNSPLRIGKKLKFQTPLINHQYPQENGNVQNLMSEKDRENQELQKNVALLSKKFHLGKKVVKYIQSRKSFNDKMLIEIEKQMKTPFSQNTFLQFDDFLSTKNQNSTSPLKQKNNDHYPQKEVILQVKVHKRGGSHLINPSQQPQQQKVESTQPGHHRRFTLDLSTAIQKIQAKKEQYSQLQQQQQQQNCS